MQSNQNRKYYTAYQERYQTAHSKGVSWSNPVCTPIVMEMIEKYTIKPQHQLLEIGCGEGRDARTVLEHGYHLLATDLSQQAISYCRKIMPSYQDCFQVLDCLTDQLDEQFDFIFSIAVIHMLVVDEDRDGFYKFIVNHLNDQGIALICSMGDGEFEMQSDISQAFTLQERRHESGTMMVAATSCRMVSFQTLEAEVKRNQLKIIEKGITSSLPNFDRLMYIIVTKL